MVANTECPEFTTITANTSFLTTRNIAELVPNVFNRSVGTKVTLSCFETYKLVGNKYIECLSTGRWNTTMPKCLPETSGTESSSSNVSSRSSGIFGGDNQMTILIIIVIIVAVIALIILLIFCCCLIWRNGRRRYKNKTKIDQYNMDGGAFGLPTHRTTRLDTNRPQSHSEYHKRINREGYPYVTNGLYNYVWHDSSHYPDLIRYHDNNDDNISTIVSRYPGDLFRYQNHNDDNISTIARFSGHSYTHHDSYLWNDLQPYFKIPRPAYIN